MSPRRYKIIVCRGPECGDRRGSRAIYDALRAAAVERDLGERITLDWQSCFGRCTQGPNVLVREIVQEPPRRQFVLATAPPRRRSHSALYNRVTEADAGDILDQHIVAGGLLRRLIERPRAPATSVTPESTATLPLGRAAGAAGPGGRDPSGGD